MADWAAFVEAIRVTESTFRAYEQRFSRFLETSELSRVNAGAGSWMSVSGEFSEMLGAALDGARRSDGLFDPTVLPALVAAGYDRDFNDVLSEARSVLRIVTPCGRWHDVEREGTVGPPPSGRGSRLRRGSRRGGRWTSPPRSSPRSCRGCSWRRGNCAGLKETWASPAWAPPSRIHTTPPKSCSASASPKERSPRLPSLGVRGVRVFTI